MSILITSMIVAGQISDFTPAVQTALRVNMAQAISAPAAAVSLEVVSASVRLRFTISLPDVSTAAAAMSTLATLVTSPSAASTLLSSAASVISVEAIEQTPMLVGMPPAPPLPLMPPALPIQPRAPAPMCVDTESPSWCASRVEQNRCNRVNVQMRCLASCGLCPSMSTPSTPLPTRHPPGSSAAPSPPPAQTSPPLPRNDIVMPSAEQSSLQASDGLGLNSAAYDLVYQLALLVISLLFTLALARSVTSAPPTHYRSLLSASGAFSTSAMFFVSVWNQRSALDGQGLDEQLRLSAVLSGSLVGASTCLSLVLSVHAVGSSTDLLDWKAFASSRMLNVCILSLSPTNLELVQLLPWRTELKSPLASSAQFALAPLLIDLPLAGVLGYYILICTTHEAMSKDRAVCLATAVVALVFVLASVCTRSLGRCHSSTRRTPTANSTTMVMSDVAVVHNSVELEAMGPHEQTKACDVLQQTPAGGSGTGRTFTPSPVDQQRHWLSSQLSDVSEHEN